MQRALSGSGGPGKVKPPHRNGRGCLGQSSCRCGCAPPPNPKPSAQRGYRGAGWVLRGKMAKFSHSGVVGSRFPRSDFDFRPRIWAYRDRIAHIPRWVCPHSEMGLSAFRGGFAHHPRWDCGLPGWDWPCPEVGLSGNQDRFRHRPGWVGPSAVVGWPVFRCRLVGIPGWVAGFPPWLCARAGRWGGCSRRAPRQFFLRRAFFSFLPFFLGAKVRPSLNINPVERNSTLGSLRYH